MSYYDVSDIVKELGGMFFHHTSMMTTLRTSVVTVGGVMTAGAPTYMGLQRPLPRTRAVVCRAYC